MVKVLDGDNEPPNFQEMLMNSFKHCLKALPVKKKCSSLMIMSESAYVNVISFFTFPAFLNLRTNFVSYISRWLGYD